MGDTEMPYEIPQTEPEMLGYLLHLHNLPGFPQPGDTAPYSKFNLKDYKILYDSLNVELADQLKEFDNPVLNALFTHLHLTARALEYDIIRQKISNSGHQEEEISSKFPKNFFQNFFLTKKLFKVKPNELNELHNAGINNPLYFQSLGGKIDLALNKDYSDFLNIYNALLPLEQALSESDLDGLDLKLSQANYNFSRIGLGARDKVAFDTLSLFKENLFQKKGSLQADSHML